MISLTDEPLRQLVCTDCSDSVVVMCTPVTNEHDMYFGVPQECILDWCSLHACRLSFASRGGATTTSMNTINGDVVGAVSQVNKH